MLKEYYDKHFGKRVTHKLIKVEEAKEEVGIIPLPKPVSEELLFLEQVSDAYVRYVIQEAIKTAKKNGREKFTIADIKAVLSDPVKISVA